MKALLIYSRDSGHRQVDKSIAFLKKRLSRIFEVLDIAYTQSKEEAYEKELHAGENYDVLLVCGGDGTINNAINALMNAEKRPILGFLNFGTMGDFGKSFGIKGNLKKQAKVIEKGNVAEFDVGKLVTKDQSVYFGYCTGFGAFTEIAYEVGRDKKKRFGKLAYYWKALADSFGTKPVHYRYQGNREVERDSPFLMCLLGNYIGGLKINPLGKVDDGQGEMFLIDKGSFNGLLNAVHKRKRPDDIVGKCAVDLADDVVWFIDGEEGPKGPAQIEIVSKPLRIFGVKKQKE